jgi:antitoxin ParD1/3/4
MATARKTITLTEQQNEWVKVQILKGDYTNDSEYFRDLIRRDQKESTTNQALKTAIHDGFESGESNRSLNEIWAEAEAKHNGT